MKNKRSIFGLNYKLKVNLMVLSEIKSVLGYIYGSMRGVLDMTVLRRARCFALIPVLTMLTVSASAQELTSDVDRSCVGMPIVLTASGFSGTTGILDWTVSTDGGSSWDVVESTLHSGANNIIVPNMPNAENVMYQVVLRNTTEKATVSIGLETDCPDMCILPLLANIIWVQTLRLRIHLMRRFQCQMIYITISMMQALDLQGRMVRRTL